ncbi:J domain-containing protein [Hymenobacter busanensis]|uniref:J domain-containing protein n=1 Tax=Hymenobacter busanensis TaxID=2607656 RepID=A0A7L4ZSH2_9BACT|nr:J domain-containing protein [Hymenobacter busanensis]KAA9327632.1 J domain-containing protein [Hymenobacter busanensis]QHJ06028.1 hypothetical protein GUY19_01445 [Hymenobacter busanensis]
MPLPAFEEFNSRRTPVTQRGLARPGHAPDAGTPAQQAFREAIEKVESLRTQVRELEQAQREAKNKYWRQVGPLADTVVALRRSLFEPLETALTTGFFTRLEEQRIEELLLRNARALQYRFGEDVDDLLLRYTPTRPVPEPDEDEQTDRKQDDAHAEHHAHQRGKRKTKAERDQEAAARALQADQQRLQAGAKAVYRQLARANHPDLERDPDLARQKTARMQRITRAYEANDLYALLQLLAEHSALETDTASDELLARYTRALQQQQTELKLRLQQLKYGDQNAFQGTGKKQEAELRQIKRGLRAEAEYLELVQKSIREPETLRQLLRELDAAGQEEL